MNQSALCLDDAEVEELLSGEMALNRTSELEQHLTACIDCREKLEHQVGDEGWWCDTQSSLRTGMQSERPGGTAEDSPERLLELLGPTDDPNMLGRIGAYEIIGLLGQGGMGAVFKGFDRSLNRFVAIKMLLPHLAASGAARKRFAREGQAVAAVVDDHVMAIHCVDAWQGVPYLVMTYSRGVSLQRRLQENGPLEVREILRIGMQAAKGLAAAHSQGIVHRDIKPANFFLDDNVERVQLMDFGLARAVDDASLTRSGTLAGTPQYMSPEQARAETVDHRSDLFSLGSVLYAMCVGHAPFRADTSYGVLRLITDKEPRAIREINAEIPAWLCSVIEKLMSKIPSERFDSANEVAELLEDCLAHVQHPTTTSLPFIPDPPTQAAGLSSIPTSPDAGANSSRLKRWLVATAFGFAFLFAGVLVVLEMNKGTLTIESNADDVPIRIMRDDDVVKKLTVTKGSESVRIKAGNYVVEVDGEFDGVVVKNGSVSLSRHGTETVKVIQESNDALAHTSTQQSHQSVDKPPVIHLNIAQNPENIVPFDKDPGELDVSYLKTIEDITARYNKMTRPLRRELFKTSIDDLTTEQFGTAMLAAADQYSRNGKEYLALAMRQSVKDNQLASSLTFTGMTGSITDRFRQIAPSFLWQNGQSGRLVVLSKAELRYSRDGWSSSAWGDIHPPITGKWNLTSVKAGDELLGKQQFNDWKLGNTPWSNLEIGDGTLRMGSDQSAIYKLTLNHNAFPQKFQIIRKAESKFAGVFMGSGFSDNKTLKIAVDVSGKSTPTTFHTKDGSTTLLTYHRAEKVSNTSDSELPTTEKVAATLAPSMDLPSDTQVHVVGCLGPVNHHPIEVFIESTGKPMVVVMCCAEVANWNWNVDPEADVRGVILSGYNIQQFSHTAPKKSVPTIIKTYQPIWKGITNSKKEERSRNWFYCYSPLKEEDFQETIDRVTAITGRNLTSFQGIVRAKKFIINGKRGIEELEIAKRWLAFAPGADKQSEEFIVMHYRLDELLDDERPTPARQLAERMDAFNIPMLVEGPGEIDVDSTKVSAPRGPDAHPAKPNTATPWADFCTEDPSFGLSAEVAALSSLNAEFRRMEVAYRKARDEAEDDSDFNRVRRELDPRAIMPAKYLAFEEKHRGIDSGLKALRTVARMAKGEFAPATNAHKGLVEARRRLTTHYLDHHGLESIAELFDRWPFYISEADGFLQTLADKSPHRETRAKATLAQIVQGKDLLIHESELPAALGKMVVDQEDSPQFNERLRNLRKQLENMDFRQLRADLNEKLKRLADSYSDVIVENYGTAGVAAQRLGHAINKVIVGAEAPEIAATDINGKEFRLSKLRGKVVVLLFAEHEDDYKEMYSPLRQLVAKYDRAPVEFVGIMSNSDPANLLAASERGDLPWTVIAQPLHNAPLQLDWGIERDCPVYIVDKQGILQRQLHMPYYGDGGYDAHEVDDTIAELLKKPYFRPSAAPKINAFPSPALSHTPFDRSDTK